jgi:hypothetical protein
MQRGGSEGIIGKYAANTRTSVLDIEVQTEVPRPTSREACTAVNIDGWKRSQPPVVVQRAGSLKRAACLDFSNLPAFFG